MTVFEEEITPDHVVLSARGTDQTFAFGADANTARGDETVRIEDVRVGERAAVHARRAGEALRATEVRLATAGTAPEKEKKP